MRLKSLVALVLLFSFTASSLEAVVGIVRDGSVHHEATAEASRHAAGTVGDHGHEDGPSAHAADHGDASEHHGPDHKHGTAADHCTHAHGAALSVSGSGLALLSTRVISPRSRAADPSDRTFPPLHHPPRA